MSRLDVFDGENTAKISIVYYLGTLTVTVEVE